MVKFFEKKSEKEIFANGRIIVTDFRKLKKEDFPKCNSGDMFFLHYDGKIYILIPAKKPTSLLFLPLRFLCSIRKRSCRSGRGSGNGCILA